MQSTKLKTAQLRGTGLEITRVGFGAWAIGGGGWEFGRCKSDARLAEPPVAANLEIAERLKSVAERNEIEPGAAAIAWAPRNPAADAANRRVPLARAGRPLFTAATFEFSDEDITTIEGAQ
jgi:aryl-alcohol dehydrogenase-like predicted oxidoreductase